MMKQQDHSCLGSAITGERELAVSLRTQTDLPMRIAFRRRGAPNASGSHRPAVTFGAQLRGNFGDVLPQCLAEAQQVGFKALEIAFYP